MDTKGLRRKNTWKRSRERNGNSRIQTTAGGGSVRQSCMETSGLYLMFYWEQIVETGYPQSQCRTQASCILLQLGHHYFQYLFNWSPFPELIEVLSHQSGLLHRTIYHCDMPIKTQTVHCLKAGMRNSIQSCDFCLGLSFWWGGYPVPSLPIALYIAVSGIQTGNLWIASPPL